MKIEEALRKAFQLGQTYWQQADHDLPRVQDRSVATRAEFEQFIKDYASGHDATGATVIKVNAGDLKSGDIMPNDQNFGRCVVLCIEPTNHSDWVILNLGTLGPKKEGQDYFGQVKTQKSHKYDIESAAPSEADKLDAARYRKLFTIENFCCDPLWPVLDWMRGGEQSKNEIDAALDAAEPAQPTKG